MAKAKRQRRTSIRTMPTEASTDQLDALERLEQIEREARAQAERAAERDDEEPATADA